MLSVELVVIFYRHCVRAAGCPFVAALVKSSLIETIFTPSPVGQRSTGIVVTESVCLSICPRAYLWNYTPDLHQIFCACYLRPWLVYHYVELIQTVKL